MEVTATVKVNGVSERSYEGKVYRAAHLFVEGRDADSMKANIPEASAHLMKTVQEQVDKRCKAVLNVRNLKGSFVIDLVSLEPIGPGAPAKT